MRKWIVAFVVVGVAGFLAKPVSAQETVAPPKTLVIGSDSVVPMQSAPVRGGPLQRFRERRGLVPVYQPIQLTSGTVTTSGATPARTQEPAAGAPVTTPMGQATMVERPVTQTRPGLLARLRARLGRY